MVKVLGMHRVLLHLLELVSLEDILQKELVRLVQASHITVKHFIRRLQHLHFTKRKFRIKPDFYLEQLEHFLADCLYIKLLDEVFDFVIS